MDDGFRAKLLDAMRWEDKQLRAAVEKAQLDAWYRTTRESAEKTVAVTYDRLTAERKRGGGDAKATRKGKEEYLGNGSVVKGKLVVSGGGDRGEGEMGIGRSMPGGLFSV
jgi:nuclear pore complex protein Nup133